MQTKTQVSISGFKQWLRERRAPYPSTQALKVRRERLSPAVGAFFIREVDGDDVVPHLHYLAKKKKKRFAFLKNCGNYGIFL